MDYQMNSEMINMGYYLALEKAKLHALSTTGSHLGCCIVPEKIFGTLTNLISCSNNEYMHAEIAAITDYREKGPYVQ